MPSHAAVLSGAHQIFTKLAADKISDGRGGFVVKGIGQPTGVLGSAGIPT